MEESPSHKLIDSTFNVLEKVKVPDSVLALKKEPMLFSCDKSYAYQMGGGITKEFIHRVSARWGMNAQFIVDSRTHMLMPGWYPCIPGWHVDDIPRNNMNGQPNHSAPEYQAEHIFMVIDAGTGSMTQILEGRIVLPTEKKPESSSVYADWDNEIETNYDDGVIYTVHSRELVEFNCWTLHRGMPAVESGWRYFIRATRGSKRTITNEIRKQTQVYLPTLNAGW